MNAVRDRADARWLPSRFDFALFRLFAYFRLKASKPQPQPGLVLSIERHQSAVENYFITICVWVVVAAFLASIIGATLPLTAACLLALPATGVLVSVEIVVIGVATPLVRKLLRLSDDSNAGVNSVVIGAIALSSAAMLTIGSSPLRHIGTAYLLLLAANVLASLVVFLMRRRIAGLERRYGFES